MKPAKAFIGLLLILFFVTSSCNKFTKIEKSKDSEYKLLKADEYFAKKKYRYAQQLYEGLFPEYKGTQKFEDLYYKWAYSYYYQGLYREAESYFKGYLEVFPNSSRAEEIDYMRAYSFYMQSPKLELEQVNTVKAMNMMQSFINTHPGSPRIKDATEIIDKSRAKMEQKEFRSAQLFYNLEKYRAAALSFSNLMNNYPESLNGDEYKLMVVKSYYKYAKLSYIEKQVERYERVITEYLDFVDRYPESKFLKDAEDYSNLSKNHIKDIQNEQNSSSAKR
ncbi:MAG TPA: outer membrane protein assembly factor BamD [Ferruginibacter sp.]|nr:outer membrane protein assembly factor BamD [Ferruginibacter sp.]